MTSMLSEEQRRAIARMEIPDNEMVRVLRAKTPLERLQMGQAMWCSARDMLQSFLRAEHPDWTEEQVCQEVARRLSHGSW